MLVREHRIKRPDFLWMPLAAPYGLGSLAIILLIYPYVTNPFLVFMASVVLTTVIEYVSHIFIEKVFHVELWNYERKKFHFQGRIALVNSLMFGVLALLLVYVIHPVIESLLMMLPNATVIGLAIVLAFLFVIDLASATGTLARLRASKLKNTLQDVVDTIQEQLDQLLEIHKSPVLRRIRRFVLNVQRANVRRLHQAFPEAHFRIRRQKKKR